MTTPTKAVTALRQTEWKTAVGFPYANSESDPLPACLHPRPRAPSSGHPFVPVSRRCADGPEHPHCNLARKPKVIEYRKISCSGVHRSRHHAALGSAAIISPHDILAA